MSPAQLQQAFQVENVDLVPNYEVVKLIHSNHRTKRSFDDFKNNNNLVQHHVKKDLSKASYYSDKKFKKSFSDNINYSENIDDHNVSFQAFGEVLNLTLKPTKGLFKDGPQSLRMWSVRSDPNATQGLEYEEIVEVSTLIFFSSTSLTLCTVKWPKRPIVKSSYECSVKI